MRRFWNAKGSGRRYRFLLAGNRDCGRIRSLDGAAGNRRELLDYEALRRRSRDRSWDWLIGSSESASPAAASPAPRGQKRCIRGHDRTLPNALAGRHCRICHRVAVLQNTLRFKAENPTRYYEYIRNARAKRPEHYRLIGLAASARRSARKRCNGVEAFGAYDLAALLRWQENRCAYCACQLDKTKELEHVIPLSRGGPHALSNLAWACNPCNRKKHTSTGEKYRASLSTNSTYEEGTT